MRKYFLSYYRKRTHERKKAFLLRITDTHDVFAFTVMNKTRKLRSYSGLNVNMQMSTCPQGGLCLVATSIKPGPSNRRVT